ncbi:host cell division inhibitor Icd-like protein [Enterobacter sp. CCM 8630]
MAQISTSIAGGSLMTAIQNKAFSLAGLMYALRGIAYAHEDKAGITVPANASSSFSRRGDEESFETSTRGKILLTSPQDAGNLCTSTRTHGGEFLESIKKGLPTIANPVYGYSAPAKSGAGIGLPELIKAIHDAPSVFFCVVSSVHLFFSGAGIIRVAHKIMVGCAGASSEAPGSLITGKTNSAQSTTNKIGLFGGGYIPLIKEAAAMLATIPTQNPQFIWIIAAVRRDMPTITAKIHHVVAESEREARRTLAQDHVCFFAGRIRLEVAA